MAYALGLPDALRRRGLTVEVVPGWETRSAGSFNPKGAVCHWTAGPANSTTRPSLNVVTNGRPDLSGPLCNVYGARDGVAVVVAAGRANHAGTGSWRGLAGNSAVFGTEMEAAGPGDFTAAQRWAYPRINAAYCDLGGFGPEMVCGHSEWAGARKTDVNGYTMDQMRAQIAALLSGEDDDMPSAQEIADAVWLHVIGGTVAQDRLQGIDAAANKAAAVAGDIAWSVARPGADRLQDEYALLERLVGMVGQVNGITADQLAAALLPGLIAAQASADTGAVEATLRRVLGSLDNAA